MMKVSIARAKSPRRKYGCSDCNCTPLTGCQKFDSQEVQNTGVTPRRREAIEATKRKKKLL